MINEKHLEERDFYLQLSGYWPISWQHIFNFIVIYFQIWSQGLSLLPKVALVRFFGGDMTEDCFLPERQKDNSLIIHVFISFAVHSVQIFVKIRSAHKFATSYINNMRGNLINNFLNFYSARNMILVSSVIVVFNIFLIFFGKYGRSESNYFLSLSFHIMISFIILLPYRGYPLR